MREKILNLLKKVIKEKIDFGVNVPEEGFGHYSTNVAFQLAKLRKEAPVQVAEEIARDLEKEELFQKIEIAGNGFINFWISLAALHDELKEILKKRDRYGNGSNVRGQMSNVQIEFVSANPTGPLTLANGRGGFFGDVLSNVLEWAGNRVTREYFINDAGNQVKILGESILAAMGKIPVKEEYYKGDYIKKLKSKSAPEAVAVLLQEIKKSLKRAGIKHDVWFSEDKNLRKKGEIEKVLEFLKKKKLAERKDGALWLEESVLLKSNGDPTYLLVDLAYHYDKFIKRKFDLVINVWGADHHGNILPLQKGIEALGIDSKKLKVVLVQLVRLVRAGKEVKMSKRAGEFVTLEELIEEVGADVARFFFLMHSPESHMDFDLEVAKKQSQKNPVYYVQYAYVRAASILRKAGIKPSKKLDSLNTSNDIGLIRELIRFPEVLGDAAEDYQVHRLTKYAMELSRAFHNFYEKERIIGPTLAKATAGREEKDLASARLALVSASKIIFENLFKILGISAPKKM